MPYINVTVTGKPDPVLSARIAEDVSDLTKKHLRKDLKVALIVTVAAISLGTLAFAATATAQHEAEMMTEIGAPPYP